MVHRDPETGQFTGDSHSFDDIEVATFQADVGVQAEDLSGGTGFAGGDQEIFNGLEILDYDEFVDRNEELRLLGVQHGLSVYPNSTTTADGTVRGYVEISAQPSAGSIDAAVSIGSFDDSNAVGNSMSDDTIDIVGRPLLATGMAPFSDGSTGVGGGGSAGEDRYESAMFPSEFGRFHPRDELFANGRIEVWNIDDSGVHLDVWGQHVYGVMDDC